jgi:hypothetical protein
MKFLSALALLVAFLLVLTLAWGCSDDEAITSPAELNKATCEGCHTSERMLKATALPDPPIEDTGEG